MTSPATRRFHARMQRALRHIDTHLDGDLGVEALSAVAAFSRFHFHRQFTALFGIGVHRYVQLARLRRASYRLAFRERQSILEIALDSGYEGPEAFSRAFRQRFGQTPSGFRRRPHWQAWHAACRPFTETRRVLMQAEPQSREVTVVEVADTPVAILRHRGDPALVGDTVRRFIAWRRKAGLPPSSSATFNILHDDPETTPPAEFRLDLCAATGRAVNPDEEGVTAGVIPGGRCAVLRHVGGDNGLGAAIAWLYAVWLPQSGEEPRDFPLYCRRVTFLPDVPEHEAVTDIHLPLR